MDGLAPRRKPDRRAFFIRAVEIVLHTVMVRLILSLLIAAIATMAGSGSLGPRGDVIPGGGFIRGRAILVGGGPCTILIGGFLYRGLGIDHNTRRTAETVERLAEANG